MANTELRECPFCGCMPSRNQKRVAGCVSETWQAVIYCPNCRANIEIIYSAPCWAKNPEREAKRNIARLWNRRYTNENPKTRQG